MDIYTIRKELVENHKRLTDLNLRVAYYARVSTEKDEQLHSLSAQKYQQVSGQLPVRPAQHLHHSPAKNMPYAGMYAKYKLPRSAYTHGAG